MGLNGQLQKMSFGEIFQTISMCRQSGVLTLTGEGTTGRLVFSQGRLLGASVESLDRFGRTLIQKGVIREEDLEQTLHLQRSGAENLPLGEALRKQGIVSEEVLRVELKRYLMDAVQTLLVWNTGSFHFEFGPALPTQGMLLEDGLDLPSLLMEAAGPKEAWQHGLLEQVESPAWRGEWGRFLSLLPELLGPMNPQEALLLVLRYASEVLHRTVLFIVKKQYLVGAGQSGLPFSDEEADQRIKKIQISLADSSLFRDVVKRMEIYKGAVSQEGVHSYFMDQLGGEWPSEVFLAPLLAGDHVVALLYGDQAASGVNLPDTRGLEAFIRIAGLASTKLFLEGELLAWREREQESISR